METYLPKKDDIKRGEYLIDASKFVLGRLATASSQILRGKKKPDYTPHLDTGDYLTVINADKVQITGNKEENKYYYKATGYTGNLKEISLKDLLKTKPEEVIKKAIAGMIKSNRLKKEILKRLTVYPSSQELDKKKIDKLTEIKPKE